MTWLFSKIPLAAVSSATVLIEGIASRPETRHCVGTMRFTVVALWIAACLVPGVLADEVQMQNGDRYNGKVLSLNADTLVIQNELVGTLKLPRSKVSQIVLGTLGSANLGRNTSNTNAPKRELTSPPLTNAEVSAALRQLSKNTNNALGQTPEQLLDSAGPEARAKFNELLTGLLSGKLSVSDLRAQAKSTADEVRKLRGELGEDAGGLLDTYLAILDKFVAETPAGK